MSLIITSLIRSLIWRIPGMRLIATVGVVLAAAGIFLYILYALGLGGVARGRHVRLPWLSWVPIGSLYVLGACADDQRGTHLYAALCPAFGGGALALWVSAMADTPAAPALAVGAVGLAAAAVVFAYIALSWVYRSLARSPAVLLILSIVFAVLIPIFLYVLRSRLPGGGRRITADVRGD